MKPGQSSDSTALKTLSIYCLLALIGYIIADLAIVSNRDKMFPVAPPAARQRTQQQVAQNSKSHYDVIAKRNMFNSDKVIPPALGTGTEGAEPGKAAPDAPPVLSNLPVTLTGTIVHANPLRSAASLQLKTKSNENVAVRVDSDVEGLLVVTKILRNRVEFRNSSTQRLEYVEIKDDMKIASLVTTAAPVRQQGEVKQKSETEFELKRDDVNKLTANLPELLQQARAVPRMGPNGQIECFSLADIAPGSIYERLGLKRGDCIGEVNGEKIDSPGKAMDMYNALRSGSPNIQINIDRGGRKENFSYQITQ
ncbi:MAG: type II secretion system protein GspC [Bdellovibrionota bacterium]